MYKAKSYNLTVILLICNNCHVYDTNNYTYMDHHICYKVEFNKSLQECKLGFAKKYILKQVHIMTPYATCNTVTFCPRPNHIW